MSHNPEGPGAAFTIGAAVSCREGPCGTLAWVAVDPVARALTHLVVEPLRRRGFGRLVPVDLVATTGDPITLSCAEAEFEQLEEAEETHFLGASGDQDSGAALAWPYFGLGLGNIGTGMGMGPGAEALPQPVIYDRVPLGEVQVRRGDQVQAADGPVGSVHGLVIHPDDHQVTHVLLKEGHLWGRKQVAVPITAVESVDEGIRVGLTKQQIQELPPVDLQHP